MNTKKPIIIFLLCICLVCFSACRSKQITLSKADSEKVDSLIKVRKINDRTLMVIFGHEAITAIKTEKGIVVIDAGISTQLTDKYRKIIENVFSRNDFVYLINTHGHHDHIGGNGVFVEAKVVGHEDCRKDISGRWTNPEESKIRLSEIIEDYDNQLKQSVPDSAGRNDLFTQKMRILGAYLDAENHLPVKLPDITFSDSLKLNPGDTTFEMISFGKFHSNSDILIYVPEIQTLFSGDLFSRYGRPSMEDTSLTDKVRCRQAIKWIENRINNIETVIEGHGLILSDNDLKEFIKKVSSEF